MGRRPVGVGPTNVPINVIADAPGPLLDRTVAAGEENIQNTCHVSYRIIGPYVNK